MTPYRTPGRRPLTEAELAAKQSGVAAAARRLHRAVRAAGVSVADVQRSMERFATVSGDWCERVRTIIASQDDGQDDRSGYRPD